MPFDAERNVIIIIIKNCVSKSPRNMNKEY